MKFHKSRLVNTYFSRVFPWAKFVLIGLVLLFLFSSAEPLPTTDLIDFSDYSFTKTKIGVKTYKLYIADSQAKRAKGLSNIEKLDKNVGMLFYFNRQDSYSFWMKDMRFPLDFIFVDKKRIIELIENIGPDTYPQSFTSKNKANIVIELNSGEIKKNNVKTEDILDLPPLSKSIIGRVLYVYDGDTIKIRDKDNNHYDVRYIGVDAPEIGYKKKSNSECFSSESMIINARLVMNKDVLVEFEKGRVDSYNRLLAYVYLIDKLGEKKLFLNSYLLSNGYAITMFDKYNINKREEFLNLERNAKKNKIGLWKMCRGIVDGI